MSKTTKDENVQYWLELADYDFISAKAMLASKRYLHVAFMCHQTIEKALKAIVAVFCEEGEYPPRTHNLKVLAEISKIFDKMNDNQKTFLQELNPMSVETRYPEYKRAIATMLDTKTSKELLAKTEDMFEWIKQQF